MSTREAGMSRMELFSVNIKQTSSSNEEEKMVVDDQMVDRHHRQLSTVDRGEGGKRGAVVLTESRQTSE